MTTPIEVPVEAPMKILGIMARDQYGETINLPHCKYPRKELLDKLGSKSASKMYMDFKDGTTKHVGYIVGRRWFTLYTVCEWAQPA